MITNSIERRIARLESAAGPSDAGPTMILVLGLLSHGEHRGPLGCISVGGIETHREPGEAEAAFIDRVESVAAAIAKPPGAPVLAFAQSNFDAALEA